ncbi:ArsR/SmtB family transcription factor [Nocardia niigatensis]|uniref:ArsR/SmtB family transcription factor n=1 Tax=Nocardia niigatensis TaxID=209249 RepID=UPI0002FD3CEE|nr:metalloregulator ArsR/SmtB family transcription factor [Nocardia niigatensis]
MGTYQSAALDALGDPTRRAIFERLGRGPCAVGELAQELPVSRPAVSQHLKVLKQAGLVRDEAIGTRRVYRLDPRGIDALRAYFTHFWSTALSAFRDEVNRQAQLNDTQEQP